MPTQILNLPLWDGDQSNFVVSTSGDYRGSIVFSAPGSPPLLTTPGGIASGSATVSNLAATVVAQLSPGQAVTGYGIPAGTTIATIPTTTSITLSGTGATATDVVAQLTFAPFPLDITGIAFHAQVRQLANDPNVWIELSTDPATGGLNNGGITGGLGIVIPQSKINRLRSGPFVFDLVASADGALIPLYTKPCPFIVNQGGVR